MADIIATVWDFDKTLIDGYMYPPLFEDYGIDTETFWAETHEGIDKLQRNGLAVNTDTFYLNVLLKYVQSGKMKGLTNEKLKSFGAQQKFYPGVPELFKEIREFDLVNERYKNEGIKFEIYIISSGLKKIIEGTPIFPYIQGVWGCEFAENTKQTEISEIIYSIDNTTKTRALFEINKGVNINPGSIDVNTAIPEDKRRVQFSNIIYIADGPSDIPAFSVVNSKGGSTFAVYPKGDDNAFIQVEKMRKDGRVQMYAEANYEKGTTAYTWIMHSLKEKADAILLRKKQILTAYGKGTPQHI